MAWRSERRCFQLTAFKRSIYGGFGGEKAQVIPWGTFKMANGDRIRLNRQLHKTIQGRCLKNFCDFGCAPTSTFGTRLEQQLEPLSALLSVRKLICVVSFHGPGFLPWVVTTKSMSRDGMLAAKLCPKSECNRQCVQ